MHPRTDMHFSDMMTENLLHLVLLLSRRHLPRGLAQVVPMVPRMKRIVTVIQGFPDKSNLLQR